MLYPKNQNEKLSEALFKNPTSEYRCTPFWAWNTDLKDDLLLREIDSMKLMGMGGFHMHCRAGMSTRYLSDEFMGHIKACVEKARKENMLAWLYDEDKWPSGFAGGFVTEKEENRQKYLLLTPRSYEEDARTESTDSGVRAVRTGNGVLLARYDVVLDENGYLTSYRRLKDTETAGGRIWYAYLETTVPGPWFHFKGYVDTLNPAAIRDFINITHERYKSCVGSDFGKVIPAIFTDEPQMVHKKMLSRADAQDDMFLPFTTDFDDTYRAAYGESILDKLPEVCWERKEGYSPVRWRFHDHSAERFARAFNDQIGLWCKENGLLMTGHMMEEPTLNSQTNAVGECMRQYRRFGLPGVDMLCDWRELNTVKQAASAAHQNGNPGVMSEIYGVTNWDFDFRGHKLAGDWQAALGVSVRVPHLYWVSMHGEAKRDYPASIGHQSAWYKEYSFIEDHFARVNTVMTRGRPRIRVGVIHPIETFWLHYGPKDQTGPELKEMDRRFAELTDWLLRRTIDFDFICESTLPGQYKESDQGFTVGEMTYETVIVPACDTLRSTTLDALTAFARKGGKVIFMGSLPRFENALPSDAPALLAERCARIDWSENALMNALSPYRDITITKKDGMPSSNLFAAMRDDGDGRNLFLCHVDPSSRKSMDGEESYTVRLAGQWHLSVLDSQTGDIYPLGVRYEKDDTLFDWTCYSQSSLLLRMEKGRSENAAETREPDKRVRVLLPDPVPYTLSEPNVSLIDMAQWRIDDGEWHEKEEMLRICVRAKEILGLSTATVNGAQPWILPRQKPEHTLSLRCSVFSEIEYENACLALEDFEDCTITWNGQPVPKKPLGWFTDESITRVSVGTLRQGENILEVTKPFVVSSQTENMFLLGDFGVSVRGRCITVTGKPDLLSFGSWVDQGLPFYGGEVTYHFEIEGGQDTDIALGLFAAPCVTCSLDGKRVGNLSLAPYRAKLGTLTPGTHRLDLTVFASRINTFGTFHLSNWDVVWFGPQAWRSTGASWTYEYRLAPAGLLTEACILK